MKKKYSYPKYNKEYYKRNRIKIKQRRLNATEEFKQKQKEYQAKYRETHKAYFQEKLAQWRKDHSEYSKNYMKEYDVTPERIEYLKKFQKKYNGEYFVSKKRSDTELVMCHPLYEKLKRIKRRARDKKIPCSITVWDIDIPDVCPYLGIPLTGKTSSEDNTPSIDRIIPELGYVPGNIQVISSLANRMKNSANPEQLVQFAKSVLSIFDDQSPTNTLL